VCGVSRFSPFRGRGALAHTGVCPACTAAEAALDRKADFFVDALKDAGVRSSYTDSDGFCSAHLAPALASAREEPGLGDFVLADRRRRLKRLANDLAQYAADVGAFLAEAG
jgi:hypothetical protein